MRKNVFTIIASILSFVTLVIGFIHLLPQFGKVIPDKTWIAFVATGLPLMIFIYTLAGGNKDAKPVAPNAYALVLIFPSVIASIYLSSWIAVVCMILVAILIVKQLMADLSENENKH
jgi:hypothetical protein